MKSALPLAVAFACLALSPAMAASSAWHEAAGGRVRLVTSGPVGADGALRGALQIELKPGWKTYWRDPGGSGVPPQFEVAAPWRSVDVQFPAPQRHKDDYGEWAGYDHTVSLAVTLQAEPGAKPAAVDGSVFLGVCETICVPLKASVSLAVDAAATPAAEADIVASAWAALPASATAQFGVVASGAADDPVTGDTLTLDIKSPARIKDIFVAGDSGYVFGDDYLVFADTGARAMIQIARRPKEKPDGPGLTYTLITEDGAVSGLIPYP